ncbi:MAG: D-alanyl-D-alanine carboxypeptidase [Treponema sp.]|jgi:D-alanyl-D-alanine carboxypeptidase (penicillin-binding protein 5/6)|nr:D-alanyl-D-alanine carboxypeptidase [Treponema sp.]
MLQNTMMPLFASLIWIFLAGSLAAQNPALNMPDLNSQAAVLMDAATGTLLYVKNGDDEIPPASLAKLMTIHIALSEVAKGNASLDEVVSLPRETWAVNQPPRSSLMFLAPGQTVTLRDLLLGLAIPSGNDAAVAVALRFASTVPEFAERMNQEAHNFGLVKTHFVEPSGVSEENWTTAVEFAIFCREYLQLHPETLTDYHSVKEFAFPRAENVAERYRNKPGTIIQYNHNNFLRTFAGADGLKTGYIDEAGHNIAITAEREGTRFIAVILGAPAVYQGSRLRDEDGMKLLNWGFEHYQTLRPSLDTLAPIRVWKGKEDYVEIAPAETLEFTTFRTRGEQLHWEMELSPTILAPLPQGTFVGSLVLYDAQGELRRIPLITTHEIERGNLFKRLWDTITLFFRSLLATRNA